MREEEKAKAVVQTTTCSRDSATTTYTRNVDDHRRK